ncbi:hypothetical protein HMPREF0534_1829 [Limosilactobacillus reuteri CF48-3A]|uniref:Uncharacterized protein n=2 Tax=Limosilactobacillus reuteri TaxID=1598 RepID=F8DRN7_LIMRS|nr:hypothetical protein HMPREF0538_20057 [Limosilactobacillus reuteri SD2112]EEI64847.1 hypothetical protein HMPREF0534_1829 [Limosilactobacillus reuteri CF48-3A]
MSGKLLASTECWLIGIINKHIQAKKLVKIVASFLTVHFPHIH